MVKNVHYGDVLMKFGDYIDASKTELPYISDNAKVEKFKNSFLQDGDIIIADTAEDETVGKCTEIQGSEGVQLLSGLHTIACRPKEKYGPMFLGYYINSPAYHSQLKPLMQGIKVTSISKSAFQDTNMIMPKSIDEQTKIGAYFEEIDHLITLHQRKLFEAKNNSKNGSKKFFRKIYQKLYKFDFNFKTYDWEQRKAGEIFKSVSDKGYIDLPVLSASQELGMILRDEIGIDIKYDESSIKNYKRVKPGQFVIHLRSFQGGFAWSDIEGITSPAYTILDYQEPEEHCSKFWKIVLTSPMFITRLETVTYGIRDGRSISFTDFSTLNLNVPSIAEQQKIGEYFSNLDHLITLHQREVFYTLKHIFYRCCDTLLSGGL